VDRAHAWMCCVCRCRVWLCSMMSDFKVHLPDESCLHTFSVLFQGPAESKRRILLSLNHYQL
jgi:hypothetical protein